MGVLSQILFDEMSGRTKLRGSYYKDSEKVFLDIATQFGDAYPKELEKYRPREFDAYKEQRRETFTNTIKHIPTRVLERIVSVFSADDFVLGAKDDEVSSWFSSDFVNHYKNDITQMSVFDPNAIEVRVPERLAVDNERKINIERLIVPSNYVYYFDNDMLFCELPKKSVVKYVYADGKEDLFRDGRTLFICTKYEYGLAELVEVHKPKPNSIPLETVYYWRVSNSTELVQTGKGVGKDYVLDVPMITHKAGIILGQRLGERRYLKAKNDVGEELYEGVLSATIPMVKKYHAVYSGVDAEVFEKVFTMSALAVNESCPLQIGHAPSCHSGVLSRDLDFGGVSHKTGDKCPACSMKKTLDGLKPAGAYNTMVQPTVNSTIKGDTVTPFPYYQNIEAPNMAYELLIKEMDRLYKGIYEALNMKWELERPVVMSGTAKLIDREPSQRWLLGAANHYIGDKMNWGVSIEMILRWGASTGYKSQRLSELWPTLRVPSQFDVYGSEYLIEEIDAIKKANFSGDLVGDIQLMFIKKRFGEMSDQYQDAIIEKQLKPFFGYSISDVKGFWEDKIATKNQYELFVNWGQVLRIMKENNEKPNKDNVYTYLRQIQSGMEEAT